MAMAHLRWGPGVDFIPELAFIASHRRHSINDAHAGQMNSRGRLQNR